MQKLWVELNDSQSQAYSGGTNIGEEVSSAALVLIGDAKDFGLHGLNVTAVAFFGTNFGTAASQYIQSMNKP